MNSIIIGLLIIYMVYIYMLQKIKEFFLIKQLSTIRSNDKFKEKLEYRYRNTNSFYNDFVLYSKIDKQKINDKATKLLTWFNLLSIEEKQKFLNEEKEFYNDNSMALIFFNSQPNSDIRALVIKNFIHNRFHHLNETQKIFNHIKSTFDKNYSGYFDITVVDIFKHPIITKDIKEQGEHYFQFFLNVVNEEKHTSNIVKKLTYKTFTDLLYKNPSLKRKKSEYLSDIIQCRIKLDEEEPLSLKFVESLFESHNSEDNDNISNILKNVGEGLSNHYDNLVLKETMHSSILPNNTVKKRL